MNKVFRLLTATVFAVVSLSGIANAQTAATGNIEGVVTDTTGAVLPGVTVVVKNQATRAHRKYSPNRPLKNCSGERSHGPIDVPKLSAIRNRAFGGVVLIGLRTEEDRIDVRESVFPRR